MDNLADSITSELRALVGQPIGDCWRVANTQVFEFGPRRQKTNRKGEPIEISDINLHIQCRWRFVDSDRILFGRDDLLYPADESISLDDFDWDEQESVLDLRRRQWFDQHHDSPPTVNNARGDRYGGFRIELVGGCALECFPCDSRRDEYSEHWRMFGHRPDGSHFVISGNGVQPDDIGPLDDKEGP